MLNADDEKVVAEKMKSVMSDRCRMEGEFR